MVKNRLLIVDDEEALLGLLGRYLTRSGYETVTCCNAQGALQELTKESGFDLVIADLTLPDMSGVDLFLRLRESYPDLPVLLCSGYPFDTDSLPLKSRKAVWFIQKPFSPSSLSSRLEDVLAGRKTPTVSPS